MLPVLEKMVRTTMMRGAQSAGMVTYQRRGGTLRSRRRRVVASKRADLATKLLNVVANDCARRLPPTAMFQGQSVGRTYAHAWQPQQWQRQQRV